MLTEEQKLDFQNKLEEFIKEVWTIKDTSHYFAGLLDLLCKISQTLDSNGKHFRQQYSALMYIPGWKNSKSEIFKILEIMSDHANCPEKRANFFAPQLPSIEVITHFSNGLKKLQDEISHAFTVLPEQVEPRPERPEFTKAFLGR